MNENITDPLQRIKELPAPDQNLAWASPLGKYVFRRLIQFLTL